MRRPAERMADGAFRIRKSRGAMRVAKKARPGHPRRAHQFETVQMSAAVAEQPQHKQEHVDEVEVKG
jgi:hypothetical protein